MKSKENFIKLTKFSLAEELLAKESIGLPDIMRILGDRPYPLKETVKEYLHELMERKEKEDSEQKKGEEQAASSSTAQEKTEEAAAETPDPSKVGSEEKKDEEKKQ